MKRYNYSENQKKIIRIQGLVVSSVLDPLMNGERGQARRRADICREIGITHPTLSNIERGRRVAGRQMISKLARYMTLVQTRVWLELLSLFDDDAPLPHDLAHRLMAVFYLSPSDVQLAVADVA